MPLGSDGWSHAVTMVVQYNQWDTCMLSSGVMVAIEWKFLLDLMVIIIIPLSLYTGNRNVHIHGS